ncbi:hypothetical protein [Candidatus Avelusimicrobium luingense]|uniref:hypothetical protein n=1 Tax=Candidatus Avelusimicrobium luingense TaxID=3416211 RepID=UPI003D0EA983
MQLKTALLSFILLICPCALCYGQLSFLGVNGERGYSAVRGTYVWDLDNNFIFTPSYEFYRQSDAPDVEETGATYRYGLRGSYDFSDDWRVYMQGYFLPEAVGNRGVSYFAGGRYHPFFRHGIFKDPFIDVRIGQGRTRTRIDSIGVWLDEPYKQVETNVRVEGGTEVGPWNLKAAWHKVIQYNNQVQPGISFSWADIPYMTAVVQGFLRSATALRVSYPTYLLTPYASAARYEYAETGRPAVAVSAGLTLKQGAFSFSGGVEVFEPRREETRKTFFSMSVEVDF